MNTVQYETFDTTPNASKLFKTLMNSFGYTSTEAVSDIVDNSLDAKGDRIKIYVGQAPGKTNDGGAHFDKLAIVDNGRGMNRKILQESFKFSNDVPHVEGDTGKFGFGGTAGSFALCKTKTVYTKEAGGPLRKARLNVDYFDNSDGFKDAARFIEVTSEDRDYFRNLQKITPKQYDGFSGTIVELTNINEGMHLAAYAFIKRLKAHFGETYHHFLARGTTMEIILIRTGKPNKPTTVEGTDPLLHDNPKKLTYMFSSTLTYHNQPITLRYSIVSSAVRSGSIIEDQGIYVVRNNRQIVRASSVGGLWKKAGALYRAGRIELSLGAGLDTEIGLTASKNKIVLTSGFSDFLRPHISKFRKKVGQHAQTSSETKEELKAEEKTFEDKVSQKASSVLPEIETSSSSGKSNSDSGRGPDKGSRKPRDPNNQSPLRKKRSKLRFVHVEPNMPTDSPYWTEMDEALNVVVYINDKHSFIIDNYIEAGSPVKEALRKVIAAQMLTFLDFEESKEITSYTRNFHSKLTTIHELV